MIISQNFCLFFELTLPDTKPYSPQHTLTHTHTHTQKKKKNLLFPFPFTMQHVSVPEICFVCFSFSLSRSLSLSFPVILLLHFCLVMLETFSVSRSPSSIKFVRPQCKGQDTIYHVGYRPRLNSAEIMLDRSREPCQIYIK